MKIPAAPGYQFHFAEEVRQTSVLTEAVGLITTSRQTNNIIERAQADMVSLARQLLSDPYFPSRPRMNLDMRSYILVL